MFGSTIKVGQSISVASCLTFRRVPLDLDLPFQAIGDLPIRRGRMWSIVERRALSSRWRALHFALFLYHFPDFNILIPSFIRLVSMPNMDG